MSKANATKSTEAPPTRRRAQHFVPIDEAPPRVLSDRARELLALLLCGFCLYAMVCLATYRAADIDGAIPTDGLANLSGAFGHYLAAGFCFLFGYAAWAPFLVLLAYSVALFGGRQVDRLVIKALGALVFASMLALWFAGPDGQAGLSAATPWGAGGAFGANLSWRLQSAFGSTGRILLLGFGTLVSFLLVTEWLFSHLLERTVAGLDRLWRRLRGLPVAATAGPGLMDLVDGAREAPSRPRRATAAKRFDEDDEDDQDAEDLDGDEDDRAGIAAKAPPNPTPTPRRRRGKAAEGDEGQEPEVDRAPEPAEPSAGKATRVTTGAEPPKVDAAALAASPPPAPPAPPSPPKVVVTPPKPKVLTKPKPKPKRPAQSDLPFDEAYPFPPIELFREPTQNDLGSTAEMLQRGGEAIVAKLLNFGIKADVVAASVGPAVTQYELRLDDSIRVGKIVGFEADLAAALKAVSVRVVAPIPGKDTVGIEVPNSERQKVFMRDLLDQFGRAEDLAIPLFLGKDVAGNPIVEDLARMPHLLIAGTTGSGKSVCINTILLSILMTRTPAQVKLILVDPKMVELQAFKQVPHLCCDVVTNMKKAPSVLQWAVDEMENRYALLSAAGVNHIRNYNRLGQQELEKRLKRELEPERIHLPYIVIVIDEFADLMNVAQNEVEDSIQRLAQKSRAVGMHVILATQRPSTEVITGIIKANLPCQIAFRVSRKIDSRVILDANGAEKLLGFGDMLYVPPGGGAMLRAQGTFVADEEMQGVVRFLEEQGQRPDFLPELMQTQGSSRPSNADRDDLYRQAVEIILGQQRGSATLLQRALAVGYTRATRLLEMMEEDGIVGPFVGSKSREVLLTLDEWKAREIAVAEELARLEEQGEAPAEADGEPGVAAEGGDDEQSPEGSGVDTDDAAVADDSDGDEAGGTDRGA